MQETQADFKEVMIKCRDKALRYSEFILSDYRCYQGHKDFVLVKFWTKRLIKNIQMHCKDTKLFDLARNLYENYGEQCLPRFFIYPKYIEGLIESIETADKTLNKHNAYRYN